MLELSLYKNDKVGMDNICNISGRRVDVKLPPIASLQFETVLAHVDCCREWCLQLTNKGRYLKSGVYEFDLAELDRYRYRQGTQHYRTLKLQLPLEHVC